ncbi:MAG TPA: hypothetical protein VKR24_01530, partial [Candidatus Limnocylindrales bacterium]|nr:hypothetical protein [Candidatus Limnocylindrales bacterium]
MQTQPEEATFLVQDTYGSTCATDELCSLQASNFHWVVVGRVDPVPLVAPAPSTSPAPSLQPVQPLTVGQLNAFMATNALSLQGRQLVITGTIEPMTPVPSCVPPAGGCPPYVLAGTSPLLMIPRAQGIGPRSMWSPVVGVQSTFVTTLVNDSTLQYEGPVDTDSGGQAWLPSQLSAASEPSGA